MTAVDQSLRSGQQRRDLWSRLRAPVVTGAAFSGAVTLVHLRDPHESGSYAFCPFFVLTGQFCPGCGGLRAVHDLTHGDLTAAVSSNVLVVVLVIPLAVLVWMAWSWSRSRGRPFTALLFTRPAAWSMLVVVLAFALVRNLPFGSWLAP